MNMMLEKQMVARRRMPDPRSPGVFEMLHGCHDDIRTQLDLLEEVGTALSSATYFSRRNLAALYGSLAFLHVVIPLHSEDEEDTLFPELVRVDPLGARMHLAFEGLRENHRNHGVLELRLEIAVLMRDARTAGRLALEIVEETREHLTQEEETLFPRAERVLTDEDLLDELAEEIRERHADPGSIPVRPFPSPASLADLLARQ